jgi:hypothetical protein
VYGAPHEILGGLCQLEPFSLIHEIAAVKDRPLGWKYHRHTNVGICIVTITPAVVPRSANAAHKARAVFDRGDITSDADVREGLGLINSSTTTDRGDRSRHASPGANTKREIS